MEKRRLEDDIFGFRDSTVRKINSKVKGNTNERQAAKAMELWTGVKFARTPQSGALRRVNSENLTSDIYPDTLDPDFYYPWSTETKHLKTITIQRVMNPRSAIFTIWNQVHADAKRSGKLPIALLRENMMPKGEYYVILETRFGGSGVATKVPTLFSGSNGVHQLIGFRISHIITHLPYPVFASYIKKRNFVSKFILYAGGLT